MNGNDMFRGMQYLDTAYVEEAEFGQFSPKAFSRDTHAKSPRRMLLIAAAISLALLLVGCGVVYLLNSQALEIDQREMLSHVWTKLSDEEDGHEAVVTQRVLSISGRKDTPTNQAAREWYDFEVAYAQDHDWDDTFACPPEYEHYYLYSQEMVDKLEEILVKYNLKPAGTLLSGPSEQGILDYLGLDRVLLPGAPATAEDLSVAYYENGLFNTWCDIQMEEGGGRWPYRTHVITTFIPNNCLDNSTFILDEPDKWEEWNYRTASGEEFLILYRPDYYECYAVCYQEGRSIGLYIQTAQTLYTDSRYSDEVMNPRQVEQLLEAMDFSITPIPGDPALLSGLSANYDATSRSQTQDGYTVELVSAISDGHMGWITLVATVPENTATTKKIDFDHTDFYLNGESYNPNLTCNYLETGEMILCWYDPDLPIAFAEGTQYSLVLEGLHPAVNPNQVKYSWKSDATWKFDFTFDPESNYDSLEFVSTPTELPDEDNEGMLTVTRLSLYSRSAAVQMEESISVPDPGLTVILKDGTAIPLRGHSGTALNEEDTVCMSNLVSSAPIPLDEVDHLLLADGTKLSPAT